MATNYYFFKKLHGISTAIKKLDDNQQILQNNQIILKSDHDAIVGMYTKCQTEMEKLKANQQKMVSSINSQTITRRIQYGNKSKN